MRVIIVGAGEVGRVSAETISKVHDVLVIDKDEAVFNTLKSRLNVSTLKGDSTNPKILRYAMENHKPQMIIATLKDDASNLFICLMAKRIDPNIITVSSITDPDFRIETTSEGVPGVDTIISPELITAQKMFKLCVLENAIDYESVSELDVDVAIFGVDADHDIVGKVCMLLDIPEGCTVFAIYRDGILHTDTESMEIHPGDHICVFGKESAIREFNKMMGLEFPARAFVILGGSIVGRNVAKMLAADHRSVKIIDRDEQLCRDMSRNIPGLSVICADFTDPEIQSNENVFWADSLVATSHNDETNLLMSMTAQRHNTRKVITRYFTKEYEDIFEYTGIETIIGYYKIVSNEITKCTAPDESIITKTRSQSELFFIHKVDGDSLLKNVYVGDLQLPEGSKIVAIKHKGELMYPRLDTRISASDEVVFFSTVENMPDLSKIAGKDVPEV